MASDKREPTSTVLILCKELDGKSVVRKFAVSADGIRELEERAKCVNGVYVSKGAEIS